MKKILIFILFFQVIFGENCEISKLIEETNKYIKYGRKIELVEVNTNICFKEIEKKRYLGFLKKYGNIKGKKEEIVKKVIIYPYVKNEKIKTDYDEKIIEITNTSLEDRLFYDEIINKINEINNRLFYLNIYEQWLKKYELIFNTKIKEKDNSFSEEFKSNFLIFNNGNEYYIFDLKNSNNKKTEKDKEIEIFKKIIEQRKFVLDYNNISKFYYEKKIGKYPIDEEIEQLYINLENSILELDKMLKK